MAYIFILKYILYKYIIVNISPKVKKTKWTQMKIVTVKTKI